MLPFRILRAPTAERAITVDGAFGQPGLELSHWPGNRTPKELRQDLSTGVALSFARLPAARRDELARGSTLVVNNHYDTDGACALLAVQRPELALRHADALLAAARAGDFFQGGDERAFVLDATIGGLVDAERSPWRATLAGLDETARHERTLVELVERFEELLAGDLERFGELWRAPLERLRADRVALARAQLDDLVHLDCAVITADARATNERFDPGRHALWAATERDRVLAIGPRGAGATYRFLIGTRSWFDLGPGAALPRPDLAALAMRLNEMEGTRSDAEHAWRAQPVGSPSPELWFGAADRAWFEEHATALGESRLPPSRVKPLVFDALREAWSFPDE